MASDATKVDDASLAPTTSFKIIDEPRDPLPADIDNATLLPTYVSGTDDDEDVVLTPHTRATVYRFSVDTIHYNRCMFNKQTGTRYFVVDARRILCDCFPFPIPIVNEYTLRNPRWDEEAKALVLTRHNTKDHARCKVDLTFYCKNNQVATIDEIYRLTEKIRVPSPPPSSFTIENEPV